MERAQLQDIVKQAGALALTYYHKDYDVTAKADDSPVTEADVAVHEYLLETLEATNIPILSEESEHPVGTEDTMWVIDPIDGTKDFIHKTDEFAVMVALVEHGEPVLAVVFAPALDELYSAKKGEGAFIGYGKDETQLHVSTIKTADHARMCVSRRHPHKFTIALEQALGISSVIPVGSIGIKLARIASGRAEIVVYDFNGLGWWDVAAPQLILEEAGGTITGTDGSTILYSNDTHKVEQGVVATNGPLHNTVLETLVAAKAAEH